MSSSYDSSGPSDESRERPSPYDNRTDVTRIIAALERVIPYENPHQNKNGSNNSIIQEGNDTDTSGGGDHTRSYSGTATDLEDTRFTTDSSYLPTDAFSSSCATNDRSTTLEDDDEDIFDGLEMEPDYDEESIKRSKAVARRTKSPVPRAAFSAPSQTSSATDITSNRLLETALRSTLKAAHGIVHQNEEPSSKAQGKKHSKSGYTTFRAAPVKAGAPSKSDKAFKQIFADEDSSSDDSSYSSDTYTVQTLETPRPPVLKSNGLVKAFIDFLTFDGDESVNTMESESRVSPAVGLRGLSRKKPVKTKPKYSASSLDQESTAGPASFASSALGDLIKLMDCSVGNDDLLRTTEQHLTEEFGISSSFDDIDEPTEQYDPEVETLVYDAAFFDDLWNELASRQPSQQSWNLNLCGSIEDSDSVASGTENLSPEEQKFFNAVFPPTTASKTARRKAAQVLSVCKQRFPSLYQSLITQLDRKARRKTRVSSPTLRVSTPVSVLPSVQEEGTDNEADEVHSFLAHDWDAGFAFSQSMLSSFQETATSFQETATSFMSGPSSTFMSELSDFKDRKVPVADGAVPSKTAVTTQSELVVAAQSEASVTAQPAPTVTAVSEPIITAQVEPVVSAQEPSVEKKVVQAEESFEPVPIESDVDRIPTPEKMDGNLDKETSLVANEFPGQYIDADVEERLVLNYASTDKECKESDDFILSYDCEKEDESTYILHFIEGSSDDCFIAEVSRDESSDDDLLVRHVNNDPSLDLLDLGDDSEVHDSESPQKWETFTPPRRRSTNDSNGRLSPNTYENPIELTHRSASLPPLRLTEQWEHFTPERKDLRFTVEAAADRPSPPKQLLADSRARDGIGAIEVIDIEPTPSPSRSVSAPKLRTESSELPGRAKQINPLTPKMERAQYETTNDIQSSWEAFSAPYFESAKEQELVATVKRGNTKKPLKLDKGLSQRLERRAEAALLPEHQHMKGALSPTSVAPPKIRKLRVADLYPPNRLDFEEFDKKKSKKSSFKSYTKLK